MSISKQQAEALAGFIRTVRPAWDHVVLVRQLGTLKDRDLADVAHAAIRTAQDESMRTPQAIGFDSEHWRVTTPTATPRNPKQGETCTTPGHEGYYAHHCAGCRADALAVKHEEAL